MTPEQSVIVDAPSEPLGSYLKRQRERRSMSTTELSRITRIPLASLEALESDRFDELPGEVFVRGFLRAYAQAVSLLPAEGSQPVRSEEHTSELQSHLNLVCRLLLE